MRDSLSEGMTRLDVAYSQALVASIMTREELSAEDTALLDIAVDAMAHVLEHSDRFSISRERLLSILPDDKERN